jgi:predicted MPP superfamily phosphohydrolase
MKTSNKVMAHNMSYARRPMSLRAIMALVALATFTIGSGVFVVVSLTAKTESVTKHGRIVVNIYDLHAIPTAAPTNN